MQDLPTDFSGHAVRAEDDFQMTLAAWLLRNLKDPVYPVEHFEDTFSQCKYIMILWRIRLSLQVLRWPSFTNSLWSKPGTTVRTWQIMAP
jgi:hypothetical protein